MGARKLRGRGAGAGRLRREVPGVGRPRRGALRAE